jgi:hypothetical protein
MPMPEQLTLDPGTFVPARSAVISPDGLYRYRLDRRWAPGPTITWVMLNPSTANSTTDDPTLKRVTNYSRAWGFGALTVANLYAWRATNPRELWQTPDPVGPENDRHLIEAASGVEVVAAWGANARPGRIAEVLALPGMGRVQALEVTKAGQPKHPLYLRGNLVPFLWRNPNA